METQIVQSTEYISYNKIIFHIDLKIVDVTSDRSTVEDSRDDIEKIAQLKLTLYEHPRNNAHEDIRWMHSKQFRNLDRERVSILNDSMIRLRVVFDEYMIDNGRSLDISIEKLNQDKVLYITMNHNDMVYACKLENIFVDKFPIYNKKIC